MATRYVTASGSGSTGTSWDSPASWASVTLNRGDVVYLAGGSYGGKTLSTATSGTTLITIKKGTATDHGTDDTGWANLTEAQRTGQATFSGGVAFNTSYWTFDGQYGGGPIEGWTSACGFKITETTDAVTTIEDDCTNVSVRHVHLVGGGVNLEGNNGFEVGFSSHDNTYSYCRFTDIGLCPIWNRGGAEDMGATIEYCYVESWISGNAHSELASISGGAERQMGDWVFRYNLIVDNQGTGGIIYANYANSPRTSSCRVYGNIWYRRSGYTWDQQNGLLGGWTGPDEGGTYNMIVTNNTFIDVTPPTVLISTMLNYGGNIAQNNLFYNCVDPGGGDTWDTVSHNHFISTTTVGTNTSTGSGNPFTDYPAYDFSLTANTPAGTTLAAPYNVDMFGNAYNGSGTWTRGAIAFGAGGSPPSGPVTLVAR